MFSRQAFRAVRAAAPQRTLARVPARSYAAAPAQEVRPPVAVYGLDGTYATALVRQPIFYETHLCTGNTPGRSHWLNWLQIGIRRLAAIQWMGEKVDGQRTNA